MSALTDLTDRALCRGTQATRSLGDALAPGPSRSCSATSFIASPSWLSRKRTFRPTAPRTTTESLLHPTKRTEPAVFQALMATVGRTARAASSFPSAGPCTGAPAPTASAITPRKRRRLPGIAGPLEHLDLLPVGGHQQLPERRAPRIALDRELELFDGPVDDAEVPLD